MNNSYSGLKTTIHKKTLECLEHISIVLDDCRGDINLSEFDIDSIAFVSFIVDLEETFNILIPDYYLTYEILQSLTGLENLVFELLAESSNEQIL